MPSINPDLPLLKTTDLTKQLRSRDSGQSLLSLLDLAERVLYGTSKDGRIVNVHFPKKEEWLIEWAVQRLKEEEGDGGVEARLSGRFWTFLLELLRKTDWAVATRCLRKHSFLQLVGMTMEECHKRDWTKRKLWRSGKDEDGDAEMEMEIKDSIATELGPAPKGDVIQRQQNRSGKRVESISGLLGDVAAVVRYLQESTAEATGFGGSAVLVLRGPPELGGQVLGGYLDNIHLGLGDQSEEEELDRAITGIEAMVGVWKSCVYGNADLKKTSAVFSKTCLLPAYKILSSKIVECPYIPSLEKQVTDYIFTPAFLAGACAEVSKAAGDPKPSAAQIAGEALEAELCGLLSPLQGSGRASNAAKGLANLMKIGISKTMQGSTGKLTKVETVGRIFASLLGVPLGVQLHGGTPQEKNVFSEGDANIIYSILTIISQNGLSISDETLRAIVDLAANLPFSRKDDEKSANDVRWPIIELALTLDFDTFIISQSTSLLDRLVFALSASWCIDSTILLRDIESTQFTLGGESTDVRSDEKEGTRVTQAEKSVLRKQQEGLLRIISLLLEGFLKARDLDGFLAFWRDELNVLYARGGEERVFRSIWTHEGLVAMFSNAIERGYFSSKVDKVLASYAGSLSQNANLADIFILDAILRGIRREETEERLKNTGTLTQVFNILAEGIHKNAPFFTPWLGWQALYRVLQIDNSLLYVPASSHVTEGAVNVLEKCSFERSTELGGLLASYQIVFLSLIHKVGPVEAARLAVCKRISVDLEVSPGPSDEYWDGAILSLTPSRFHVALLFTVVKRWLRAVEALEAGGMSSFIEFFMERAAWSLPSTGESELITVRDIWDEMLRSGVLFELPGLRDRIIANITSKCDQYKLFFFDTVARVPLETINSKDKVTIARVILDTDILREELAAHPRVKNEVINKLRAAMARLMDQPVAGQKLHESPDTLLAWFHSLNWGIPELRPAQQCTIAAGEKILKRAMLNKDQPQNIEYLAMLFSIIERNIRVTKGMIPSWQLALLCLRECFNGSTGKVKDGLQVLRIRMLKQADALLGDTKDPRMTAALLPIYGEALFLDTEGNEPQIFEAGKKTAQILNQWLPQWNSASTTLQDYEEQLQDVLTGLVHLRCLSPQTQESVESTTALVIFALTHPFTKLDQRTSIITSFTNMTSRLSLETYLHAISTFLESCFPISPSTPQEYYALLSILLSSAKKPTIPSKSSAITERLSKIYSYLAISLHHCTTQDSFLTLSSCMHTLLRTHPWCISQFNIDETLTAINICTSPGGPSFAIISPTTPDDIYTLLTRLLLTLLLGHRFRLKGRYHLLIATLQSLLRCLYSLAPHRKKLDKPIHPPWLSSPSSTPLSPVSATAFTRILTTLCDPVASTVSRHTSSALLTSRTGLARKEVARYVPYVMMEHVYWQLQPQRVLLQGGNREALAQGVYALFEVMKSEEGTLKRVNAGLDAQGRALFKRMYEDFGRYGVESLR
ncbi:Urb2/Npa2 family-domain-containing protein [Tirmania nivea]|nr:Urb2/Npa2 family-domain-containing protein [Tirmania nivea]